MMKRTNSTRLLSLFLSLLMALSAFSVLTVEAFAAGAGSVTNDQWNALANALRSDNVKNASYKGNENVTVDDPSGDVYVAAQAYYSVLNAYIYKVTGNGGSQDESGYNYRTSSQVRDLIKNKMQELMGGDYETYGCAGVLNYLGGNVTVSGSTNTTQNSVPKTTVTVTVTRTSALLNYATLDEADSVPTYKYTITHSNTRKYKPSGCGAKDTYYCTCSGTSETNGTADVDISSLRALETALNDNAAVLDADQAGKIALGYDALAAAYNAINTAWTAAETAFNALTVDHFFHDDISRIAALEAAMKIAQFVPFVERINEAIATDITDYALAALTTLYENLKQDYNDYKAIGIDEVYAYFETDNNILSREAVDAKYEEIENAYQIAYLRENVKPQIDADVETFGAYDDDWVLATDNADAAIGAALTALSGYATTLGEYKPANVDVVFGENYLADTFTPLRDDLNALLTVNEYKERFAAFRSVYVAAFEPVDPDYTTDQLYSLLSSRDAWYTDLQAYAAELEAFDSVLAQKIMSDLEAAMEAKIDSVYALLNARIEATVNNAYDLYQGFVAEYGYTVNTSDDVTVNNYNALRSAFGLLNPDHYEFLLGTEHFTVTDETVAKYEEIRDAVFAFVNFDASKGLSAYKYNRTDVEDIIRAVSSKDYARNADYDVTDEKVEAIIDILEEILASDTVKESFDLSGTIGGVLDNLYTDDFLNTLVQYVYPLVTKEFAKVWADLPTTYDLTDPVTTTLTLNIDNMPTALGKMGLKLLPNLLASDVGAYPEVAAQLAAVPGTTVFDKPNDEWVTNPWENENIYDAETGKLTLAWGITDKESFLNAASVALSGVAPLLLALISNKTFAISNVKIGTGSGSYSCVNINVDPINLNMTFSGNPGYNNAVAPILAALGADTLPNGNSLTTIRAVLENGLIAPLEGILAGIAEKPLDSIIRLLPTLAFALHMNLASPLLNELKTNIDYKAIAKYDAGIGGSGEKEALSDSIGINLGEMINLADMGIDLTSLNGLLNSVLGLLTKSDDEEAEPISIELPEIDEAKLSMLGTDVKWIPAYRTVSPFSGVEGHGSDCARIIADNRADIFLSVLEYAFRGIDQYNLLDSVLELVNSKKTEEEEKVELSETIQGIIDNAVVNSPDSIAAVVELLFPQRYDMDDVKKIDWITEGNISESDYQNYWTDVDAEGRETLWTKEKAVYMAEHLGNFADDVVTIFSEKLGDAQTLGEAVAYLLNDLFKADTANSLAGALKDFFGGLELPEIVTTLGLLEQLGLDLHAWDEMTFSFADGDAAAFKAAVIECLEPLAPVLRFILAEEPIEITLLDAVPVKALGYDGYSYGIVPLLEALGCSGVKSTAAFKADKANIVRNIVNPVFTLLDTLQSNPLVFIEDLVPALIYFDKVGGVQAAVPNLLFAVNVLLDTIRPVYDLDIYQLVDEKLGLDIRFLETDPVDFLLTKVGELISENTDIELKVNFTVESLSERLHFTDPIKFRSANGDDAYTIKLSPDGKADLLTQVLDYGVEEIVFEDNIENLKKMLKDAISDENLLALMTTLLENLKMLDEDVKDFHGIQDTALATIFWIFYGADTVADADADFFHRFNQDEDSYIDFLMMAMDSSIGYMERFGFIAEEILKVEYPNLMTALENSRRLLKPFMEYDKEDIHYMSGILTRLIEFFMHLYIYLKSILGK